MALTHLFCLQYFFSKNEARFHDFHHPRFHEIHDQQLTCLSDHNLRCCRNRLWSRLRSLMRSTAKTLSLHHCILFHSFNQLQFNWIVNTRSNVLEIFIIDYFRSYLCYLDGFSGNYIHSHFNFSFCITCPALRLTYFHNLNQLCQLTFFSKFSFSPFLAIDWELCDLFSIASILRDIPRTFETI